MKKGYGSDFISIWQRFWRTTKLDCTTGCWNWTGGVFQGCGRPRIKVRGKTFQCHRLVMLWLYGELPKDKLVCHHCDNILCVNPQHLFFGTSRDNVLDMHHKGRNADITGEKNAMAKLTNEKVAIIRRLLGDGVPGRQIAKRMNIGVMAISRIKNQQAWIRDLPY